MISAGTGLQQYREMELVPVVPNKDESDDVQEDGFETEE